MKKAGKPFKIIVDTNIWISFLIGKSLKGLQKYIDSQKVLIITWTEQIQEFSKDFLGNLDKRQKSKNISLLNKLKNFLSYLMSLQFILT